MAQTFVHAVALRRRRAASCGDTATVVGVASGAALVVMFAVEVPRGGPYVFGTTNDVLGAAYQLLTVPVLLELGRELPDTKVRQVLHPVTVGSAVVAATSGVLLVAQVLPFGPSTAVSIGAVVVQAGWMLTAGNQLLRRRGFPERTARWARRIGGLVLGSLVAVGVGLTLPEGSARTAALTVAAVPGGIVWLAWPIWFHLAARHLRNVADDVEARAVADDVEARAVAV
ncbi:hypothetical protein [Georgenia subflava]|uniref:DUF998 domain-containing protein n=1 Tax=Georgenia subflava TaxID=1622177 RepID=A0A6N7ETV7_9MICO|nr:hypothetical protein [Georgenia subflava]MPV38594.1 hypothetical protein [Georgenia subflava]